MRWPFSFAAITFVCAFLSTATIIENGQVRLNPYPGQATKIYSIKSNDSAWRTYQRNAPEIGYKGRWCANYISWWAAPGIKFGYTGDNIAVTFGKDTSHNVLLAWRVSGLPWNFANVTADATYHFVKPGFPAGVAAGQTTIFEFRVSNWNLGVQINAVHVDRGAAISKVADFPRKIEMIGDSLTAGYTGTYESTSGTGWNLCEGFGNVEFSIIAYTGICLTDKACWGSPRGQLYQWMRTSDTSPRAIQKYGQTPPAWPFSSRQAADIVIINLGTNDASSRTTTPAVSDADFQANYIKLIKSVFEKYPNTKIIVVQPWMGYYRAGSGNTYRQSPNTYKAAIRGAVNSFGGASGGVHYFDTSGILQHSDINPKGHPTDVGHIKLASHLMQFIKLTFGWNFQNTGQEVQSHTMYWNNA
ncbi:hypothetical protein DRE_04025 [Drechslerella stenobrocha 248]|uniref:SGNH hydrolase-type esterase domain-containing protein n=1 Tax=Drechslerella stenobrocha 248 TaxID=1043628 RepID=W7ICF0_9PEZI|nr:hypothetical protein DRE_04025 [Drechslerella stenobrocha 248]